MKRASIRFRITAVATLVVVGVLGLASIGVVVAQHRQLTATLDSSLQQRADDIAALLESADTVSAEFGSGDLEGFAQLVAGDGSVLASSPNLRTHPAIPIDYTPGQPETIRTVADLPIDDDAFRVLSRTITSARDQATLHVGTTYDFVGESTEALTTGLAVALPIASGLLAGLIWWLVGRTLQPVEAIRAEVASIGAGDLDRRVPEPATTDEIGQLAATMNQMLARIENSVAKQQQFVADASHELRSPLTRMRTEIEVDLANAAIPAPGRLDSLHEEVVALQRLVEDLLHLARSDAGHIALQPVPVDLDDLVISAAGRLKASGDLTVDLSGVSAAQVVGDAHQLARAVANLSDNAARHTSGVVCFTLDEGDKFVTLTVTDDGPGIASEDMQRVFERFTTVDESRNRTSGGSGLGLSITRDIVERHGGTIEVDSTHSSGARFVVRLPRY